MLGGRAAATDAGLTSRVARLAAQLSAETTTMRFARWAARHPPRSEFLGQIAEGGTGRVHEVMFAHTPGVRAAVKCIDWSTPQRRAAGAKRVATEIALLQVLQHPLLPTLHQVYMTSDDICLEMTLCERGTLWHKRVAAGGTLTLDDVRQYAAELVCVLSHLHQNGIVYVDLKPENVLLQDCGHIMLCDMDLAHTSDDIAAAAAVVDTPNNGNDGPGFWGTLEYVAPEVVTHGAAAYSPSSDWWGLGVLLYELLLGLVPWDGSCDDAIVEQIRAADVVWPPRGVLHPEADSLIRALLMQDPAMRLGSRGVYELQAHPFFASVNWSTLEADAARDRELAEAAVVAASRRLLLRDADGGNGTGNDSSGRGSSSGTYGAFVAQRRLDTGERWEPRRTRARWC